MNKTILLNLVSNINSFGIFVWRKNCCDAFKFNNRLQVTHEQETHEGRVSGKVWKSIKQDAFYVAKLVELDGKDHERKSKNAESAPKQ